MNPSLKYSVQIISEAGLLTEALNLRHNTYKKVYPKLIADGSAPYESDAFDTRSIHLGLYYEEQGQKKLAGYSRLALPRAFKDQFAYLLIETHPQYSQNCGHEAPEKLPFIERLPLPEDHSCIDSYCDRLESQNIMYAETSRFIIDEQHRSLALASFFVNSMFAVCESLNIKYSFFTCTHHHISFYQKMGLTLFIGIEPYDNEVFGKQYVIFGTNLQLASAYRIPVQTLRVQLETEHQITYKKAA